MIKKAFLEVCKEFKEHPDYESLAMAEVFLTMKPDTSTPDSICVGMAQSVADDLVSATAEFCEFGIGALDVDQAICAELMAYLRKYCILAFHDLSDDLVEYTEEEAARLKEAIRVDREYDRAHHEEI